MSLAAFVPMFPPRVGQIWAVTGVLLLHQTGLPGRSAPVEARRQPGVLHAIVAVQPLLVMPTRSPELGFPRLAGAVIEREPN
jgi:hypothetical protein